MSTLEDAVEFVTNPEPRCACALILDTSGSMTGPPIEALNAGLQILRDDLCRDLLAQKRVEIAVVEFNTQAHVVCDFATADNFRPPALTAKGTTDLAGGINEAFDLVRRRKRVYDQNGIPCYRPWAFLITDGKVTPEEYERVGARVREEEGAEHVVFFAVGVQGADEACLRYISVRPHKMLDGLKFRELFLWLSASLHSVSSADLKAGEMKPLPPTGTWEAVP